MYFEPSRSQHSGVNHVESVGGADDQHVLLLLQAIDLAQELIHHRVAMNSATNTTSSTSSAAKGINLVDDDDV
jgi:hypothetical protein